MPKATTRRPLRALPVALALGLLAKAAGAEDFQVTRSDDPVPGACAVGDCSLREAVIAANVDGGDRILLPAGTYALTLAGAGEDLAATGDLDLLANDIELRGTGAGPADVVIDATGLGDRILEALTGDARILNLTLRRGSADQGGAVRSVRELTMRRVVFDRNAATGDGGAIHSSGDTARVTVEDATFDGNTAARGGAIWNQDASTVVVTRSTFTENVVTGRGGAIYNQNDGAFTLHACRLAGNQAADDGGAIFTQNTSSFTVVRSLLTGNRATEAGGAIFVQNDSALTIIDTTISDNTALGTGDADGGGAIYANNDSALVIERSTISGNRSEGDAGGISRNNDGQLLLQNSTVSGNTAGRNGGGLLFDSFGGGAFIAVESSTVTGNTAAALGGGVYHEGDPLLEAGFLGSIVADNLAGGTANDCATDGAGVFTSHGFNLDGTDTCGLDQATDRPGADPQLGPLDDNGGPTATHALLPGSPALEGGPAVPPGPTIDQRGIARPQGAGLDIGAFELVDAGPTTTTTTLPPRDPYKCWRVKDLRNPKFPRQAGVRLDDAFRADTVDVVKPFMVCNPADTDGAGAADPSALLCCYGTATKKRLNPKRTIAITDPFGDFDWQAKGKPKLLCQPCSERAGGG